MIMGMDQRLGSFGTVEVVEVDMVVQKVLKLFDRRNFFPDMFKILLLVGVQYP